MSHYNQNQYGGHPPQGGYGGPPPQQGGYGGPPPQQGGYGGPPPNYGGGGYGNQQYQQQQQQRPGPSSNPARPPQGADPALWQWFQAVDTDNSGCLTTEELQKALINGDWSPFNLETVRLMMNMFDTDNSGTITFTEFAGLWRYIDDWKKCFQTFDADRSGTINFSELKTALKSFGYNLGDSLIKMLIQKYDKYGKGDVTFDNFVQSCVTIKTLTDAFRRFDNDNDGWIMINYEQFLSLVVNNR